MDRRIIIFGLILLGLLMITLYKMSGKRDVNVKKTIPGIMFSESSYTINPTRVETYKIENYTIEELSSYVNMTVRWINKGGFENVESIKIQRILTKADGTSQVLETKEVARSSSTIETESWFTNFSQKKNEYTFTNINSSGQAYDAIGTNTFKFYYKLTGETNFQEVIAFNRLDGIELRVDEIQLAVDQKITQTVTFKPTTTSVSAEKNFANEPVYITTSIGDPKSLNSYLLNDFNTGFIIKKANDTSIGTNDDLKIVLGKDGDTLSFIQNDLSLGPRSSSVQLNIIKNLDDDSADPTSNVILGTVSPSDRSIDKVIAFQGTNFVLMNFNDIDSQNVYDSIFLNISTTRPDISADCVMTKVSNFACNTTLDNTSSIVPGVSQPRGKMINKYTLRQKAFGTGTCVRDGVNLLSPSVANTNEYKRLGMDYYVYNNCAAPTIYTPKGNIQAQCRDRIGDFYVGTLEAGKRNIPWEDAYDVVPAVNTTPSDPPGAYDCRRHVPDANFCSPATSTGNCVYDANGSASLGYRNKRWTSYNSDECVPVAVPSDGIVADITCPAQCHTPDWKVRWLGCDLEYGEFWSLFDNNAHNQKSGQPICNGMDLKGDFGGTSYVYTGSVGYRGMCQCTTEYDGVGYGGCDYQVKWSKDNDTSITSAQSGSFPVSKSNSSKIQVDGYPAVWKVDLSGSGITPV